MSKEKPEWDTILDNPTFLDRLTRFVQSRCPECGGMSAPFGQRAWPYCVDHADPRTEKPVDDR